MQRERRTHTHKHLQQCCCCPRAPELHTAAAGGGWCSMLPGFYQYECRLITAAVRASAVVHDLAHLLPWGFDKTIATCPTNQGWCVYTAKKSAHGTRSYEIGQKCERHKRTAAAFFFKARTQGMVYYHPLPLKMEKIGGSSI